MDLYVLVRLLKNQDTDMLILYLGGQHCEFLFNVLYTYCGYSPYARIPIQLDPIDQHPIRCIDLKQLNEYGDLDIKKLLENKQTMNLMN